MGIDIEIPADKILKIQDKFLSENEKEIFSKGVLSDNVQYSPPERRAGMLNSQSEDMNSPPDSHRDTIDHSQLSTIDSRLPTLLWSAKESVFKWYGDGGVDFRKDIQLQKQNEATEMILCHFLKNNTDLDIHYRNFNHLVLAWVVS